MINLTHNEANSAINSGTMAFANMAERNLSKEVYGIKPDLHKAKLLWLYVNAINYYELDGELNYLTEKEFLSVLSKLHVNG
jgi:hypothetical protein